jgi:hypothetical protein
MAVFVDVVGAGLVLEDPATALVEVALMGKALAS